MEVNQYCADLNKFFSIKLTPVVFLEVNSLQGLSEYLKNIISIALKWFFSEPEPQGNIFMEKYDIQSETQRKVFEMMPSFFLDQEEQANFHFMMHMRLVLKSPDFMESFERDLFEKKLADLQAAYPDLAATDCADTFIKMKSYDFSDMDRTTFQKMINDASNPPIIAKGFLNDTKAVQEWTHDYLIEHYKDTEIIAVGYDEKETV